MSTIDQIELFRDHFLNVAKVEWPYVRPEILEELGMLTLQLARLREAPVLTIVPELLETAS